MCMAKKIKRRYNVGLTAEDITDFTTELFLDSRPSMANTIITLAREGSQIRKTARIAKLINTPSIPLKAPEPSLGGTTKDNRPSTPLDTPCPLQGGSTVEGRT